MVKKEHALYRDDEYIYSGTIDEIADRVGVSRNTILFYKSPTYLERRKNSKNYLRLYELNGDIEDERRFKKILNRKINSIKNTSSF